MRGFYFTNRWFYLWQRISKFLTMAQYDLIVIGSGPGGYVAAIRASQLGMKVGVVEKAELGGICLNWGCIPTKALLKSANVFEYFQHAADYGIKVKEATPDIGGMVKRSRDVAASMSKGIEFLFKKNKIDAIAGYGKLKKGGKVEVTDAAGKKTDHEAKHIILATGGRSRELPNLVIDGKKIIGYREAMILPDRPQKMLVVGSGAIGAEFAYFYSTIGTEVTIVEFCRAWCRWKTRKFPKRWRNPSRKRASPFTPARK